RPQGLRPLPGVPLAILSDPFAPASSAHNESWEWCIEARNGTHDWKCDHETKRPRRCKAGEEDDRIPEISVSFAINHGEGNGRAVWLGGPGVGELGRQVVEGLNRDDLAQCGGELMLHEDKGLSLPRMNTDKRDLEYLAAALDVLRESGERRVWMLYSP